MESASERLSIIFEKLKSTDLVKKGIVDENTINRFNNILNLAIPVTREDRVIADVFRFMYTRNRKAFYKNIQINNMSHMVLFTDGLPIVNVLRLRGVIVINWNSRQNEYIVKKYNNKSNVEINSTNLTNDIISDEIYIDMINNVAKEEKKITSWADAVSDEESEEFDSDS